jgi:4-amino-4-deoxy-L-arabinose transferase-like glycosyltransferase
LSNFWNKKNAALLVVVAIGLLLRVWGINHGLPSSYYPDERHFINRALSFGTGDLNPHWFHKPALYMYLLFFEYGLFFLMGKIVGLFGTVTDFARLYVNDLSSFLIIGRATTALFGTATVLLTYVVGKKMYGKQTALIAACFLACTFAHVKSSHHVKADIAMAFFVLLSFLYIYQILEKGSLRNYLLAGLFAGLGVATKYSPVVLVFPLFIAHLLFLRSERPFPWRKLINGNLLLAFLFLGIGFFLGSPFNFLDPYYFQSQLSPMFQAKIVAGGAVGDFSLLNTLKAFTNPLMHCGRVILRAEGMGAILGSLSLLGIPFLIFRGRKGDRLIVLTALTFVYSFDLLFKSYAQEHHLNFVYPFLCLGAAAVVFQIMEKFLSGRPKVLGFPRGALIVALPILLVLPSVYRIVLFDYRISHKDTRTVAKEWVEMNIPVGTKILVDDYCVPLKMSPERVKELANKAEAEDQRGPFTAHASAYYRYYFETVEEPTYYLLEISHPWWKLEEDRAGTFRLRSEHDRDFGNPVKEWGVLSLKEYRALGFQYLITTHLEIWTYLRGPRGARFPSFLRFYQEVEREAYLLHSFHPHSLKRPGPKVFIYQL